MKYQKGTVVLTKEEWSVLSTIAERVLAIMEPEGEGIWRDAESVLVELSDSEMKLACELCGSNTFNDNKPSTP